MAVTIIMELPTFNATFRNKPVPWAIDTSGDKQQSDYTDSDLERKNVF